MQRLVYANAMYRIDKVTNVERDLKLKSVATLKAVVCEGSHLPLRANRTLVRTPFNIYSTVYKKTTYYSR